MLLHGLFQLVPETAGVVDGLGVQAFRYRMKQYFSLKISGLALNHAKPDNIVGLDPEPVYTLHIFIICL